MKTKVDFTGWRFVSFPLGEGRMNWASVEYLVLYYNSLPAQRTVTCHVDDMRAYRVSAAVKDPTITVGRRSLTFPVELSSGAVLRYSGDTGECKLRTGGNCVAVIPTGKKPKLRRGTNRLSLAAECEPGTDISLTAQIMKRYRTP